MKTDRGGGFVGGPGGTGSAPPVELEGPAEGIAGGCAGGPEGIVGALALELAMPPTPDGCSDFVAPRSAFIGGERRGSDFGTLFVGAFPPIGEAVVGIGGTAGFGFGGCGAGCLNSIPVGPACPEAGALIMEGRDTDAEGAFIAAELCPEAEEPAPSMRVGA